ncbi:hypothetical protein DKM44_01310 [Deinococcus irradiatisoli]|uniref:GNAT family N-acetyltransferase n=1 Tax=Deinococcus irradiatisoli TaxID=2202254 RepID=A0A2Z3JAL6_9DEIO|nr:hypothetical protein [Deinococcus irradiatisoli]AWN22042.1 hypothetical protein DKM44_01310 [Deinococcus irradiatisoli]
MSVLPARVRVSRLPLPPASAVQARLRALFGETEVSGAPLLSGLSAGAVAVAGGKIIGAALHWPGGEALKLESGWRGRGIEEALQDLLAGVAEPSSSPAPSERP